MAVAVFSLGMVAVVLKKALFINDNEVYLTLVCLAIRIVK